MKALKIILAISVFFTLIPVPEAEATRIKDISHFEGIRPNQLIGYGLVVGLDGTGDNKQAETEGSSL